MTSIHQSIQHDYKLKTTKSIQTINTHINTTLNNHQYKHRYNHHHTNQYIKSMHHKKTIHHSKQTNQCTPQYNKITKQLPITSQLKPIHTSIHTSTHTINTPNTQKINTTHQYINQYQKNNTTIDTKQLNTT